MKLRRIFGALFAAFAAGLCLSACSADSDSAPPSLSQLKDFQAYPVYYSGTSVAGNPLVEVMGDPDQYEDEREASFILIYGECKDPPDEGGCPPPLQIHSQSTCTRWASLGPNEPRLFDLRGAKAHRPMPGGGASLEIFTGQVTVTMHAESQNLLDKAVQALRTVHQKQPTPLPPPAPGSLEGKLPCQGRAG